MYESETENRLLLRRLEARLPASVRAEMEAQIRGAELEKKRLFAILNGGGSTGDKLRASELLKAIEGRIGSLKFKLATLGERDEVLELEIAAASEQLGGPEREYDMDLVLIEN